MAVHKYNRLMKDFSLNDLDKVHESLTLVFSHLTQKPKLSPSQYPIRRGLPPVEAMSRDLNDVLLQILTSHRLAYTPYPTFLEGLLA
jgi:hypothetical protein